MDLLVAELVRCAAVGALKVDPHIAAELMSANVGLALNQIATPSLFDDPTASHLLRDAVIARVLGRPRTAGEGDGLWFAGSTASRCQDVTARPERNRWREIPAPSSSDAGMPLFGVGWNRPLRSPEKTTRRPVYFCASGDEDVGVV
ncbi:hypothetical protein [Streptomyces sp. NPDC048243]|uniref:hypothetical protein n=1 Tax=Streptomyces sp. NPDC048243 TaxID=3365522 RepID=UPI003715F003